MRRHHSYFFMLLGGALVLSACESADDAPSPRGREGGSRDWTADLADDPSARLEALRATGTLIESDDASALIRKAVTWRELTVSSLKVNGHGTFVARGGAVTDEVCVLSGVGGDHDDHRPDGVWTGPFVTQAATWELWLGETSNTEGQGRAICAPWSNFRGPAGTVKWVSDKFKYWADDQYSDIDATRQLWWGDAASYVAGVLGEFEGYGEQIYVNQSTSATTASQLRVRSVNGNAANITGIRGEAFSIFVGDPNAGKLVTLYGYGSAAGNPYMRGNVKTSGTFEMQAATDSGFSGYWLAKTGDALCYLTYVGADFDGRGDDASIFARDGWWFLQTEADDGKVKARARCMAYDQR